jgi:hypothetical protein
MIDRIVPAAAAAAVVQALLSMVPAAALAQTAADSAASAATGVYPARPAAADTGRAASDTASAARSDSAGLVPPVADSAAGGGQRADHAPAGPLVVNLAPPDTTLMRACEGEPGGSPAPGLLAVVFRAGTSDQEQAATAKAVGGVLAGPTAAGGEVYVRLPADAPALTVAADELIREDPVSQVSPALCPLPAGGPVPAAPAAGAPASGSTTRLDTTTTVVPDSTAPRARGPFGGSPG